MAEASAQRIGLLGPMASTTTILTRHDVTAAGSDLSASMMLDDHGSGHIMVSTAAGASFSMDAAKLQPLIQLLAECDAIRGSLFREPEPVGLD